MSTMQIVMLSVGGLALLAGCLMAIQRLRTVYFGKSAQGKVVGQSESMSSTSSSGGSTKFTTLYAPIVEFAHEGKKVKFTSSLGQRERIAEGASVPVRYLPADPGGTAEIATPARMWGFPIAALGVGALFVVLGIGMGK
jgi:hypothetical protein